MRLFGNALELAQAAAGEGSCLLFAKADEPGFDVELTTGDVYQRGFDAASDLVCAAALDREVHRAALELAAKTCEALNAECDCTLAEDCPHRGMPDCIDAIRALIDSPPRVGAPSPTSSERQP